MTTIEPQVLIVEDNPLAGKLGQVILQQLGCRVDLAVDGAAAMAYFKPHTYHFILMDIGLPDINGYEVAKMMRLLETEGTQTPILVLTAHIDKDTSEKMSDAQMQDMLQKPLTPEQAEPLLKRYCTDVPLQQKITEC